MEGAAATHGILRAFLLILVLFGLEMNGCRGARLINPPASANVAFIKSSCGATIYPRLCFSSLSAYANKIHTSPMQLANTALSLAVVTARSASAIVATTSAARGMKPGDAAAVRDCMELMGDSVEQLQQSLAVMGHLGGREMGLQINNMQTWVSAALTDEDTCVEGFQGRTGTHSEVKNRVRNQVLNVAQMTSNALALINGLVSSHSLSP